METNNQQPNIRMVLPDTKVFGEKMPLGSIVRPEMASMNLTAVFAFERAEYPESGGIERYFHGCLYPEKGFPFPQALYACSISKRYLLSFIRLFAKNKFVLIAGMLKKGFLNDLLRTYNESADLNLSQFYYNNEYPRYYSPACKEIKNFLEVFLKEIGVNEEIGNHFAKIFITLIDYDNAYRYRIQDCADMTNPIQLKKNFIAELDYIFKEYDKRDNPNGDRTEMTDKFAALIKILKLCYHIPKFRKAIKKGLEAVNWEKLVMDEADTYFTDLWIDYNFRGEPFEVRREKFLKRHEGKELPPMIQIKV